MGVSSLCNLYPPVSSVLHPSAAQTDQYLLDSIYCDMICNIQVSSISCIPNTDSQYRTFIWDYMLILNIYKPFKSFHHPMINYQTLRQDTSITKVLCRSWYIFAWKMEIYQLFGFDMINFGACPLHLSHQSSLCQLGLGPVSAMYLL